MIDSFSLYLGLKIIGLLLLAFLVKTLYDFVYKPWRNRVRFGKHKNVAMVDKFYPFLGDLAVINSNEEQKNSKFSHYIRESLSNKGYDLRLNQMGPETIIDVCSIRALDEMEKLIPSKIDRSAQIGLPIGNLLDGCLGVTYSDENWKSRRKEMTKTIGINFCSKYIPMMIKTIDKVLQSCPLNKEIDLTHIFTSTTFEIITKIFFGQDITDKMDKIEYVCPISGKKSMLKFQEFYPKIAVDEFEAYIDPKGKIIPFLAKYKLIEPFKTNARNVRTCYKALSDYLDTSLDKDSVYYILYSSGKFTKHECVMDALMMLFAGFDTSSHLLSATINLLKKNPEKHAKLMKELERYEITKMDEIPESKLKSIFNDCDYLNHVSKEAMRMDNATIQSVLYEVVEDCQITGVRLFKGEAIGMNIAYPHYDPNQWRRPEEFLPERFDPENELFYKPGTKEARHPKSFIPFTFGIRNCLGQTLAKLEVKVILARFLTKVEYEISKNDFENNFRYSIYDVRSVFGTITSRK